MHTIHTTEGFIIDSRPYGEADKLLSIFTRDFGLVMATAQGIRLEKSKLRYYCQDYSFGTFSLVRGKEFWRLTSAQGSDAPQPAAPAEPLFARIAQLLRRLIHGEEPVPGLYE
jgi:DNA repair protein RecO (recombination protein O)